MRYPHALVVGSLLAAGLSAQLTITDANMVVDTSDPSATSNLPRTINLRSDAIAADQAFEHWWYYRISGDTEESALKDIGVTSGGITTAGDHADRDFDDVDARGLLKASIDMDTYSAGPASGVVISRLTVMNTSNAPYDIDLFGYTDIDVGGTFADDTCTGTLTSHFITDPTGIQIEVRGIGATSSDVLAYPALRSSLSDAVVDNLADTLPPFAGDYTGAFQWTATLQPFEQRTFTIVIAVDSPALVPPLTESYGAGNGSVFEVHATEVLLQDLVTPRTFAVRMKNALPSAEYRIVTGVAPWTPLPFIPGVDLWVDPLSLVGVYGGFTDANGEAQEVFTIPPSPYLTGFSAYHQCFYVDAAAPNGFAYFTPGLRTRVGKL